VRGAACPSGLWFSLGSRGSEALTCVRSHAFKSGTVRSDHSGRVSDDPVWLPSGEGGPGAAWDPVTVPRASSPSGGLLTVLQVVDDPRDGLLSCGAHLTLRDKGKQACESADTYSCPPTGRTAELPFA